ncbi:hypothetical protein ACFSUS_01915 [Spirosoma soli]|uniref:Lipocalin-like domain-containing protein n=1 Tax=Spirosoma soli TaxID=1770529 RepID=A0ABW5LX50_9BACT
MKKTFTALTILCLFVCFGCKQEADIDLRDRYIGRYDLTVTSAFTVANTSGPLIMATNTDFLYVSKGEQLTELRFEFSKKTLVASLKGEGKFDIAPQTSKVYMYSTGTEYLQNFNGEGSFTGNRVTLRLTSKTDFVATQSKEEMTIKGDKLP